MRCQTLSTKSELSHCLRMHFVRLLNKMLKDLCKSKEASAGISRNSAA